MVGLGRQALGAIVSWYGVESKGYNDGKRERRVGGVLGLGSNNNGFDHNVHCNDKEKRWSVWPTKIL
jgi:hypothetical protein